MFSVDKSYIIRDRKPALKTCFLESVIINYFIMMNFVARPYFSAHLYTVFVFALTVDLCSSRSDEFDGYIILFFARISSKELSGCKFNRFPHYFLFSLMYTYIFIRINKAL